MRYKNISETYIQSICSTLVFLNRLFLFRLYKFCLFYDFGCPCYMKPVLGSSSFLQQPRGTGGNRRVAFAFLVRSCKFILSFIWAAPAPICCTKRGRNDSRVNFPGCCVFVWPEPFAAGYYQNYEMCIHFQTR